MGVVNENGQPLILQYAGYLGMDPVADSDLLWIAQQAMTADLPAGWTEHSDPMSGDAYFHNGKTGETVWEHPCDAYYRNLYEQLKAERQKRLAVENTTKGVGEFTRDEVSLALGLGNGPVAGLAAALGAGQNRYLAPLVAAQQEQDAAAFKKATKDAAREEKRRRSQAKLEKRQRRAASR
eukprot:SAG31_NODE_12846_length_909_cov_1.313653_1_plen_179_part_01